MDNVKTKRGILIKASCLIVLLAYFIFLYIDAEGRDLGNSMSISLKFITILMCFILSLFIGANGYSERDKLLIWTARLFTVIADYCLVILDNYNWGILFFCIVQIIYIIRHSYFTRINLYRILMGGTVLIGFLITSLFKAEFNDINRAIVFEAAFYGCLLLCSVYVALSTKRFIIALGMFLFLLCDINVAIYNLTSVFIYGFLMWLFYLPSQLLLTLSGFKEEFLKEVFKG